MDKYSKFMLSEEEKNEYITNLTNELVTLRAKAEISQDDLANAVGISRQTYGSIERKKRKMSWNTFLTLVMYFDYNEKAHDVLAKVCSFPSLYNKSASKEADASVVNFKNALSSENSAIFDALDQQALNTINTVVMVEYSRCRNMSTEATLKFFEGMRIKAKTENDKKVAQALQNIKRKA